MKKIIFSLCTSLLLFGAAHAQIVKLSAGADVALPTGNSANITSIGIGSYVKLEEAIAPTLSVTQSVELVNFFGKRILGNRSQNLGYLPIKLGLKYFTSPNFYAEGQGGVVVPINTGGKTSATWSLGVGSFVNTGNNNAKFDLGLRYQALTNTIFSSIETGNKTNFGYIALRAGYVFGF